MSEFDLKLKTGRFWAIELLYTYTPAEIEILFTHREIQFSYDGINRWSPFPENLYERPLYAYVAKKTETKTMVNWLRDMGYSLELAKRYLAEGRVEITYDKSKTCWMKAKNEVTTYWGRPVEIKVNLDIKEDPERATGMRWVCLLKNMSEAEALNLFSEGRVKFVTADGAITPNTNSTLYLRPSEIIVIQNELKTAVGWVVEIKKLSLDEADKLFAEKKVRFDDGTLYWQPSFDHLCVRPKEIIIMGTPEADFKYAEEWLFEAGLASNLTVARAYLGSLRVKFDIGRTYLIFPVVGNQYRRPKTIWLEEL